MKQGFVLGLAGYGAIAAVAVIAALGIALKIQSARLESCQIDRAKLEAANMAMADSVEKQNRAIDSLLKASDKRIREAQAATEAARRAAGASRSEAARLKALQAQKGSCEQAVQEVKKGLHP